MSRENVEIVRRGMDWAQVCTLRDGLVRRLEAWTDRQKALEAVGLRESG